MNYISWLKATEEKRLTYTSGSQESLRASVIDRLAQNTEPLEYVAGVDSDDVIWSAMFTQPIRQNTTKLVVVREVEHLKTLEPLKDWFITTKKIRVVWDSVEPTFSSAVELHGECSRGHHCGYGETNLKNEKRTCKTCDEAARLLSGRGRTVVCDMEITAPDILTAVSTVRKPQALALIDHTNSIDDSLAAIEKLNLLDLPIDIRQTSVVLSANNDWLFAKELTVGSKFKAIGVAVRVTDMWAVLEYLSDWLFDMTMVTRLHLLGKRRPEIAQLTGLSWPQTSEYLRWVGRYGESKLDQATFALADAMTEYSQGARIAVLQLLAMNW